MQHKVRHSILCIVYGDGVIDANSIRSENPTSNKDSKEANPESLFRPTGLAPRVSNSDVYDKTQPLENEHETTNDNYQFCSGSRIVYRCSIGPGSTS
jgi:hypothetical protein